MQSMVISCLLFVIKISKEKFTIKLVYKIMRNMKTPYNSII